jgi:hypothetical protein
MSKPTVVCLCGSTRFYKAFQEANYRETMAGNIVLSVGFYPHSSTTVHGETQGCTPAQKKMLDDLHKHKIDMCDEILVLNCLWPQCPVCGAWSEEDVPRGTLLPCCHVAPVARAYVGDSTRGEIAHARMREKPVRWLIEPTMDYPVR